METLEQVEKLVLGVHVVWSVRLEVDEALHSVVGWSVQQQLGWLLEFWLLFLLSADTSFAVSGVLGQMKLWWYVGNALHPDYVVVQVVEVGAGFVAVIEVVIAVGIAEQLEMHERQDHWRWSTSRSREAK